MEQRRKKRWMKIRNEGDIGILMPFIMKGRGILGDGTYTAYIYEDNEDGNGVVVRTVEVTSDSVLSPDLLENGGAAVKITQDGMDTTTASDAYTYYEAENATLGGATTVDRNNYASGLKSVGWFGNGSGNSVTFENASVEEAGTYELNIYFITGEARDLYVSVNGGEGICLSGLTATSNDWSAEGKTSLTVILQAEPQVAGASAGLSGGNDS